MKYIIFFIAAIACSLCLSTCSEEESNNIDSKIPFYQKLGITFTNNSTFAFAHFSKNTDKAFAEIKLEGDQSIKVNGQYMNYHKIDELEDFISYSYSKILQAGIDKVTFTFTRNRGEVYKNEANKSQIQSIAIPADFKLARNGKTALIWIGAPKSAKETIEATVSYENNGGVEQIPGEVQENGTSVVFELSQVNA